jgi:hypothetical protein
MHTVTDEEFAAIARRAFGRGMALRGAEEIATGTVNSTWRLTVPGEPPLILRLGPTNEAATAGPSWLPADTLQREHALSPWLAPVAPLLPKTVAADFTHQLIDRDWVIQTLMPGQPWSELAGSLTDEQDASLWQQLGAITREIHSVAGTSFGPLSPGRSFARWSNLLAHDCDGIVADFERFGLPVAPVRRLRTLASAHVVTLDGAGPPRLIHSDLDRRHVFVTFGPDGSPRISGFIDYEFGRFADPLSESLLLSLALDRPTEAEPFFAGYGPVPDDETTRWRMRLYQAIVLGWSAGDQARLGRDAAATIAAIAGAVDALADS